MTKQKMLLLAINLVIILVVLGLTAFEKETGFLEGIHPVILLFLVLISVLIAVKPLKKRSNNKTALAVDDELSLSIKYKAGYYAYLITMLIWVFIFLVKERFPNPDILLGVGIMLSAISAIISRIVIKRKPNE